MRLEIRCTFSFQCGAVRHRRPANSLDHSPRSRTLACSHTAVHSPGLPFNGLHPLIQVITWITTNFSHLDGWEAEMA